MSARQFWAKARRGLLLAAAGLPGVAQAQAPAAPPAAAQPGPTTPAGEARLLPLPATVPLSGGLTLGFRLRGAPLRAQPEFPELEGFRKGPLQTTTATQLLPGGGRRTELLVRQQYLPYAEGVYVVPAYTLTVNGQTLRGRGGRVQVGAGALATQPLPPGAAAVGSLDQLLGKPKPRLFYEPSDAGALALEADRPTVFVGQGVQVSLYFYLDAADQALLQFYDFNNQLTDLQRQLRQPGAWEVLAEGQATPDTVRPARPGQSARLRFRLARRTYYPLTARALDFPRLRLTLTKFQVLKNPQPGDTAARLARYKTYAAAPLRVAVRPLPGPGTAVVGTLSRRESLGPTPPRTGQTLRYALVVEGQGNPAALAPPAWRPRPGLEVFGPEVQDETLADGQFRRRFSYRLVARRPGPLPLDGLWQIPYFDPAAARYDTLRSALRPRVQGPTTPEAVAAPTDDSFYGPALAAADAQLQPRGVYGRVRRYAAGLLGALLLLAGWGWWRAGRG